MPILLNGAPLNGGFAGIWAEAQSTAGVETSAVPTRIVFGEALEQACEATSVSSADRIAWTGESTTTSEADRIVDGTRLAYTDGSVISEAVQTAVGNRTAWMAESGSSAESAQDSAFFRERYLSGSLLVDAGITVDDEFTSVLRVTTVRDTRGIAHTSIREGFIDRILVNQVQFTSTTIARSYASGIANTQLGFGTCVAEAGEVDDDLLVNVLRDGRGTSEAECLGENDPSQTHIISGAPVGEALLYIAPDIIRSSGTVERYLWAISETESPASIIDGLALRSFFDERIESDSESNLTETYYHRGVEGLAEGYADSESTGRVNRWVRAEGTAVGEAAQEIYPDRLAWVGASGASDSTATSNSTNIRYRNKYVTADEVVEAESSAAFRVYREVSAEVEAGPSTEAVPYRIVTASSVASTGSDSELTTTITYHWAWASASSEGEAISEKADGLRQIRAVPVKPIFGEAVLEKTTFSINASKPAPDRRTITLVSEERVLTVPENIREVVV